MILFIFYTILQVQNFKTILSQENMDNGLLMHNKVVYIDKRGYQSCEGAYTMHNIFIYSTAQQNPHKL